ncbi:MDR family MFS transporter [Stackebrandtia nassauensis]|uniref:Drug resistance transporter, EmrB/QacA subfamily n=1 Tax=Stackebrandtia nassauensis (strain DSM 44728 / CIP 108903 / NRRL B-16338 / NBRC 102104 / LLR-40K-21) TaxID=446470 RepID=D3Q2V2_STANL|nr:MDR family MFS transporter [Stackebrandtia nassauensis]ADD45853.1 drug resistance transporter, EmrB/QacA subfamily [Stackebrandtia nassauensis DSM 44728]
MSERRSAQLSNRHLYLLLVGLMLTMLLAALDQTIVGTALPTIVGDLGGLNEYAWVVTAYLLAATASTPLYGKLSDLYGRRPILLSAIVIFLVGSLLAGMSQNMMQLIFFRGLQGLGAGGLMTLAFTVVSDVVSPRERGRYQGFFGAVFGFSSVAGPLLGGWLADVDWRWIFYINLPGGIVALVMIDRMLKLVKTERRQHKIDYVGAAFLVASVVCLLLATSWGGKEYDWDSPVIIGLFVAGGVLAAIFLFVETRAEEPILPLRLFKRGTFSLANAGSLVLGVAMFGGIIYVPLYLQIVRGYSPTESGLLMLPMMLGIVITSIVSGRAISAIGRYKWFIVVGAVLVTTGLALFTQLHTDTPLWQTFCFMAVLGVGLGLFMQPLVLAVQNSVAPKDLGAGTSTATFFRSLGGAFGVAAMGAVMTAQVAESMSTSIPEAVKQLPPEQAKEFAEKSHTAGADGIMQDPASILALPAPLRDAIQQAFVTGLDQIFIVAACIAALAVVIAVLLPNYELRGAAPASDAPEDAAAEAEAHHVV